MKTQRAGWKFIAFWLTAAALAWTLLIYPLYILQPFKSQDPQKLLFALSVIRYRPIGVILEMAGILAAVVWYWRLEHRKLRRFFSAIAVLTVGVAAALSSINIFEIMFKPAGTPAIAAASETKLDDKEMVIAVKVNGIARAYPIRSMSYHHIFNDIVAGEPIVATY